MKKDYDSTRIYRNTHKKRVRHRLMTHPPFWLHKLFKNGEVKEMTAKQTDDRNKTDSLQQMTATYKKNRKIILFCSTQEKRKIFQHKLAESTQRLTRASPSSLVFQTHTSTRLRSIVAEHQTFKPLQNLQTHTQKGDTESINRRTKKCPDITSGQFLRF